MLHTLTVVALTFALVLNAGPVMAAGQKFAHAVLQLHGGPGSAFAVVATVAPGTSITVMWCNGTADWCLVDDGVDQGWAPLDDIRAPAGDILAPRSAASGTTPATAPEASAANNAATGASGATLSVQAPGAAVTVKLP